jgi:basic amino acid/polyamine antiporter, APA family
MAIVIALSGKYEQILNYVVSTDFVFFGLTALCLFVLRHKEKHSHSSAEVFFRVPGHPLTTLFFIAASWIVVVITWFKYPKDSLIGLGLLLAGIPIYYVWKKYGKD